MSDIHQKIKELKEYKNLNFSTFGEQIGVTGVAVSDIIKGKSKPNFKFLQGVLKSFPEISAEWLLRDEGEMLRNIYQINDTDNMYVRERRATYNNELQNELINCQKRIIELQDEVATLQKQLFAEKLQKHNILKTDHKL